MADDKKKASDKADTTAKDQTIKDLKDLGDAVMDTGKSDDSRADTTTESTAEKTVAETEALVRERIVDEHGRSYATGRRKNAVARVWLKPGKGSVIVNGVDQSDYFPRQTQRLVLNQPFLISERMNEFDVMCTVKGGGLSGQAGAVRLGISRALQNYDPELRGALKKAGMLTRDARIVERKKVGKHKARRSKQWAKR